MDWKLGGVVFTLFAAIFLAGCDAPSFQQKPSVERRMLEALPVNRFVVGGSHKYSNGTDLYLIDTRYGDVCTYFVSRDPKLANGFEGCIHQVVMEKTPYGFQQDNKIVE